MTAPPPATNASMSACLILPAGPLPLSEPRSIPASLALFLTAGLAKIGAPVPLVMTGAISGAGVVGFLEGFSTSTFFSSISGGAVSSGSAFNSEGTFSDALTGVVPAAPVSNSINTEPTAIMSPTSPFRDTTVPSVGDGIVTVALSVITSTTGSSSETESPTETCHVTTSPSTTPSPISGNLNS